jgi:hypothetical protein
MGNRLVARQGAPKYVFVDNGSEFTGRFMYVWAYHHGGHIAFSRPGKSRDNSHVKTFNGSLRDECLNVHWFKTLAEAKEVLEAWRRDDNQSHPHRSINDTAPAEFGRSITKLEPAYWLLEQPKPPFKMTTKRQIIKNENQTQTSIHRIDRSTARILRRRWDHLEHASHRAHHREHLLI